MSYMTCWKFHMVYMILVPKAIEHMSLIPRPIVTGMH